MYESGENVEQWDTLRMSWSMKSETTGSVTPAYIHIEGEVQYNRQPEAYESSDEQLRYNSK
jgi:hypothetical protein